MFHNGANYLRICLGSRVIEFNTHIEVCEPVSYHVSDVFGRHDATGPLDELIEVEHFLNFWNCDLDYVSFFIFPKYEGYDGFGLYPNMNRDKEAVIPIDVSSNFIWINLIKNCFCEHALYEYYCISTRDERFRFSKQVREYCNTIARNLDDLVEMSRIVRFSMKYLEEEKVRNDFKFRQFIEFESMLRESEQGGVMDVDE